MALSTSIKNLAICYFSFFAIAVHAEGDRIVMTGSSTLAPLVLEMGKRFEKQNPGLRVDVQTGGSSRGVADVRAGLADIGMVSRALKNSEMDLYAFTIALDGVAMIVSSKNPISELSNAQIIAIYKGTITDWRQLGGLDKPITVVNKAEGHSTLELFLAYFNLTNSEIKASVIIGDNQQGIKTVAGNPNAIGYVSVGAAEFAEIDGIPIKRLPMSGVPASVQQVQSGVFPLTRPLNLVTQEPPSGLVKRFIEFSRSEEVEELIADQFFVKPITISKSEQ
jgi:phosphate transport system substrate-binding protein